MEVTDYLIILVYFAVVIGLGFWYQKRASKNLDAYFLGGKRMHWLALAMSGSVSNFDITGTMWIVTLITLFGMKSMWNHWMWGFLMGAFFMSYMGKWIRRSKAMTGAEWMVTRFGAGAAGRTARTAYALVAVVTVVGFIGYAFQGIGKFTVVFFPGLDQRTCATVIFAITTLYVLIGGLYSVVITDVLQTVILTIGALLIVVFAYCQMTPELAAQMLPADWSSLLPQWRVDWAANLAGTKFKAYAGYELFGALVIIWVIKGFLLNLGGPAQMYDFQRFLAARNPRDAAKVGAAWSGFLIVRWAMAMGIALLAYKAIAQAGGVEKITGMFWVDQIKDPEKVMPLVLRDGLPNIIRSVVIAGLLAAFMSTFSSTINAGASYLVRDIWQPLVGPRANQKHLVRVGYLATLALVIVGTVIGFLAESIAQMFNWIMVELGAAFVIPNVLRWYWWRINGWGYAAGTFAGLAGALVVLLLTLFGDIALPMYITFPVICGVSLIATLAGALLTRPTDKAVLASFYGTVRPFGAWGPVRREVAPAIDAQARRSESLWLTVLNVLLGMVAITCLYLAPMYLVGHWYVHALICFGVGIAAVAVLAVTWYRNLPE